MYAAFLQEAAEKLQRPELNEWADAFVTIGDEWREFALLCARISKGRGNHTLKEAADFLRRIADQELVLYNQMAKFK
jgi:hypothetical protein